jgi:hypothetical protein
MIATSKRFMDFSLVGSAAVYPNAAAAKRHPGRNLYE